MNLESETLTVRWALIDAILGSEIEKRSDAWTYRQGDRVRAVLGMRLGVPHGPFQVYYPNGQLWIEGRHDQGESVFPWDVYRPDGQKVG